MKTNNMETNKILNADFLDLLFDGKNKNYGAYELRKTYNRRLTTAILITAAVVLLLLAGSLLLKVFGNDKRGPIATETIVFGHIAEKKEVPIPPKPVTPPPPKKAVVNQVSYKEMKITPDNEVTKPLETVDSNARISKVTIHTDIPDEIVDKPATIDGSKVGTAVTKVEDDKEIVFRSVQIEAEFPGGSDKWRNFLERNLDPATPVNAGAPVGRYTVMVEFIVSKDGTISDVKSTSKVGYGMDEEAIRVIRKGPKWIPAQQNGRQVTAYRTQPIVFQVNDEL
jgi:protein TonB